MNKLLGALDKVRATGKNTWVSCCPAHRDKSPSLAIRLDGNHILIHCFAGCEPLDVIDAAGLTLDDLFMDEIKHNRPLTSEQEQRLAKKEGHKIWKAQTYLAILTGALKNHEIVSDAEIDKGRRAKAYLQSRGMYQ